MAIIRRRDLRLEGLDAVRFWDLAATKPLKPSDDPDWTAGALLAVTNGKIKGQERGRWMLLHMRRFRETPARTDELMWEQHVDDDGPSWFGSVSYRVPVRAEQEGGSSGKRDMDHLGRYVFLGVDFQGKSPDGDKVARAKPVSRAAEARNFDIVEGDWNDAFLDEIELFPDSAHDDQVDALSGAFRFLADRIMLGAATPEVYEQTNQWGAL